MALLRRVRDAGRRRRLNGRGRILLVLLVLAPLGACERLDPELMPGTMLRDSLGLGDEDRVHRIQLTSVDNRESPQPASVQIRPGDYVEFMTADHRVHAVSFVLDSVPPGGVEFLRGTAQEGSPPLVEAEARFLVTFVGAPPGRYPFLVVGNGSEGRGAVVVGEASR